MALPIFVVHWGNSDYLKYCLHQAKKYNPDSIIYLLGDKTNNKYPFVSHHFINDYSRDAEKFSLVYKHLNTLPVWFEIFAFTRWFIIKEFITKHHDINKFIYIDTDVLLFCDVTEVFKDFEKYSITLSKERSPHNTFFSSLESLVDFCEFIILLYTDKSLLQKIEDEYTEYLLKENAGGIDDQTAFYKYKEKYPDKIGDNSIWVKGTLFDFNINLESDLEYDSRNKVINIYWKENLPYGKVKSTGDFIRFNSLHFQGDIKRKMHRYYTGNQFKLNKIYSELYYSLYIPIRKLIGLPVN